MKVIIAGSRDINEWPVVHTAILNSGFKITEVVSGGATGVDATGEALSRLHNMPLKVFSADWRKHGRAAGPIRNREMAKYADALIAIWDGESRGTKNMIDEMKRLGKPAHVVIYKPETEETDV